MTLSKAPIQSLPLPAALLMVLVALLAGCSGARPKAGSNAAALRSEPRLYADSTGDCGASHDRSCTWIRLEYPMLSGGRPGVADSLNGQITRWVLSDGPVDTPTAPPESVTTRFIDDFKEFASSMPDAHQAWFSERHAELLLDSLGVVSLRSDLNAYTGGAHGMHTTLLASYDAATGRKLALADLIAPGQQAALMALGERMFRATRGIPEGRPLAEAGFFRETKALALNDNFAVTRDGLLFFYNEYEIASYADGPTALKLPWSELTPMMRTDGPLKGLSK